MFLSRWRIQKERKKEIRISFDRPLLFLFESKSRRGTGTGGHEIRDHRCLIESAPIPQREMDTGGCSISSLSDQTRTTRHFPPHGRISSSSSRVCTRTELDNGNNLEFLLRVSRYVTSGNVDVGQVWRPQRRPEHVKNGGSTINIRSQRAHVHLVAWKMNIYEPGVTANVQTDASLRGWSDEKK